MLDLAGKPFGGDFEQLSPCKMKKMFPIARLASGVSTGGCRPQPPAPRDHSGAFYQEPNLAIFGCLWLQAVIPSPRDHSGAVYQAPKIDFHSLFFPINFNSTALFKDAFLGLDLAGRPFGGDVAQLSPCKMKKNVPHS